MAADLSNNEDGAPISAINVTPFVDVVLVLLVIFMITAPALVKDLMGIQLPKAETKSAQQSLESMGVAVTKAGQILLNGNPVTEDVLKEEVKKTVGLNPNFQVIISADTEAKHGDVVKAIDLVKSAGATKFAFQIQRPDQESEQKSQ
ncbi:MAG: ExbD/TolR family protein [Bacteriovoracia bacterium]